MKKANRWAHGTRDFVFPALSANLRGRHGCNLHRMTFDTVIDEEVCAIYMEDPAYVDQFSKVRPFNLIAHTGLARTPHGVFAFIVWQIAAHSPQEVLVEQYLNPQNIGTIRLVASAANQTQFKLIVINNQTAETAAFIDFENVFEFEQLVSGMALSIGHEPACPRPRPGLISHDGRTKTTNCSAPCRSAFRPSISGFCATRA